jgi:hypothetical protein
MALPQSQILLKALGLNTSPNPIFSEEGGFLIASNVIIKRDNVIEPRRGFKLYGDSFGSTTDRLSQLIEYKKRIIRHYNSTLQYDTKVNNLDDESQFLNFSGSYSSVEEGLRIKSIEGNGNLYFTTDDGIKKISATNASEFTQNDGYITDAGGIKALDGEAQIVYELGNQTGFLPVDSVVAYRALWGTKDANSNLILGTPSQRIEVSSPFSEILARDINLTLSSIDNVVNGGSSLLTDTGSSSYSNTLGIELSDGASTLRTNLIALALKLDTDIYLANDTGAGVPLNGDAVTSSISGSTVTLTFTSGDPTDYVSIGDSIILSGFTVTTGDINTVQTVTNVTPTTIVFINSTPITGPVTVFGDIYSYNYRNISQPPVPATTPTHNDYQNIQDYLSLIITRLQSELIGVIPSSSMASFIDPLEATSTCSVLLKITVPQEVTSSYFLQLYRSNIKTATTTDIFTDLVADDEMRLVYEAFPTNAELDSRIMEVLDIVPDEFFQRAAFLYTNPTTGEGILQANDVPPLAKDINTFKNYTFYANTQTRHRKTLYLLGVEGIIEDYDNSLNPKLMITNGTLTQEYSFVKGLSEITNITVTNGASYNSVGTANYFTINSAYDETSYYLWFYVVGGTMTDPAVAGKTGVPVYVLAGDSSTDVASKLRDKFNSVTADFSASSLVNVVTVTNVTEGQSEDANATSVPGGFTISVTQQGVGENLAAKIQTITTVAGGSLAGGDYFNINGGQNDQLYYFWFKVDGSGTDPNINGRIGVLVEVLSTDTSSQVATKLNTAINTVPEAFSSEVNTNVVTVTNYRYGACSTAIDGIATTGFTFNELQQGAINVLLSNLASPAQAVDQTARSLVRIINRNVGSSVYSYYLSGASDPPGSMLLESRSLSQGKFYLLTNQSQTGESFNPDLSPSGISITANTAADPSVVSALAHGLIDGNQVLIVNNNSIPSINGIHTVSNVTTNTFNVPVNVITAGSTGKFLNVVSSEFSDNEVKPNRIYYSKINQPEAVPLVNYFDVSSGTSEIIRIFPLRDSLFVFKEDGLYRVSGETAPFSQALFDSSANLAAPDSLGVVNNLIFCWTNDGISTISESGVNTISRSIDDIILPLSTDNYPNFSTATFGIGYDSDKSYLVWTISEASDEIATICYRFGTLTNSWTTFDKTNTCGLVNSADDKIYLGAGDTNFVEIERKTFSRLDYADRELKKELISDNYTDGGLTLFLSNVSDIEVGDVLVQDQTLTVFEYNMLLKKLDNDTGPADNDYYNTLQAVGGDDLRMKLEELTEKLDNDIGVSNIQTFTDADINDVTETFTILSHGFSDNQAVKFSTTGTLPSGLNDTDYFFIINSTTNTFQVSTTEGGSAVNVTANGSGTHTITKSTYQYSIIERNGAIITNISDDNPTIITSTNHGLQTNRVILVSGSDSVPSVNGRYSVTRIDENTFSIPVNVLTIGTTGTFNTQDSLFSDIKACYNIIIDQLNSDVNITFSNYAENDNSTIQEAIVTSVNKVLNKITLNLGLEYVTGQLVVYKAIPSSFQYVPQTMGSPLFLKHISESTIMFEYSNFTSASLGFSSDLLPEFTDIIFSKTGSGIFGHQSFGSNFFGGLGHSAPFRTLIPRNNQRCRHLNVRFNHRIAREMYSVLGITISGDFATSNRAYR